MRVVKAIHVALLEIWPLLSEFVWWFRFGKSSKQDAITLVIVPHLSANLVRLADRLIVFCVFAAASIIRDDWQLDRYTAWDKCALQRFLAWLPAYVVKCVLT